MKETSNANKLLRDAIKALPGDFALREVRFHVNQALQKLEKVEEKRVSKTAAAQDKKNHAQSWDEMVKNGVQNPHTAGRMIDIINNMLAEEHRKLGEILKKKESDSKIKNPAKPEEDEETLFD